MFMEEVVGLIVQLTASPEGEMLMCINAEPGGRGINARLTQNRFHKRYSTVTNNNSRNYAYFEYYHG